MRDEALDKLVAQYLREKGYTAAEAELRSALRARDDGTDGAAMAVPEDTNQQLLSKVVYMGVHAAFVSPQQCAADFETFCAWVDNTLDMYRSELSTLLYPVFVHMYLEFVRKGAASEAGALLQQHEPRFLMHESVDDRRQELQTLAGVIMKEHLSSNPLARHARESTVPLTLCRYSFELLMHHLHTMELWVILDIINRFIKLEVVEGPPTRDDVGPPLLLGPAAAGRAQQEAAQFNQKEIQWGLLQGCIPDKFEEELLTQQEEEYKRLEDVKEGGGKNVTKKELVAAKKQLNETKERNKRLQSERIAPEIPLRPLTDELEAQLLSDLKHADKVGRDKLPSCCMFTFVNTLQAATPLHAAAFTGDASHIAAGFGDSTIKLMALRDNSNEDDSGPHGAATTTLLGHSSAVYGLDFSLDNRFLFSCAGDGTVRLWSCDLSANLAVFKGHHFPVWCVASGPLGHYFASGGADRVARLWCTERVKALRLFVGHQSDVDVMTWHPNCHMLATASADRSVRLWDVRSGECCRLFFGHKSAVHSLAVSPNGAQLASGADDGAVHLWDIAQGTEAASCKAHTAPVWSLAYSNYDDGALLASGASDMHVKLWDPLNLRTPAALTAPRSKTAPPNAAQQAQHKTVDCLKSFRTRSTPVVHVAFTRRNLLLAAGAYSHNAL